jgi:serine protease Do
MNHRRRASTAALLAALLFLPTIPGQACAAPKAEPAPKEKQGARAATNPLTAVSRQFRILVDRVSPAVVQISALALGPSSERGAASDMPLGVQRRGGSGVILSSDGYIVTNAHVVEGARRVEVLLSRPAAPEAPARSIVKSVGQRVEGTIVGTDIETDLAVVKIAEKGLPFVELGDSDGLGEGDIVLAFGSPLGLDNSVSMGVVSALGRQLRANDPMIYIQTDTPINPGNSGGPLVDTEGMVIGINTLIYTQSGGSEGIGFAAPSNIVRSIYNQIREHGRVRRGAIGVIVQTITPTLAAGLGLSQKWGVVLADVHPQSPAAAAGLSAGDIVLSLDGKTMENARQFDVNLYRRAVGDSATVTALHGTDRFTVRVPVIAREDDPVRVTELVKSERSLVPRLGVLAVDVDAKISSMLPWLRSRTGVLVVAWAADAPRADADLRPGDVIQSINRSPVASIDAMNGMLGGLHAGDPVVLSVDRLGRNLFLAFEAE